MTKYIRSGKKKVILFTVTIFLSFLSLNNSFSQKAQFSLYAVTDLERVFEDGYKLPEINPSIEVFGIRREVISGQFVVHARNNLANVTVEVDVLSNQQTGDLIPVNAIEWNFVGSIPLSSNTPNQPKNVINRPAPARYPDYLMQEKQLDITKGKHQAIWLTISIPENAVAGTYTGKIIVRSNQGEQTIPLQVLVYPLKMPEKRNLKVTEWYNTHNFSKFHGISEPYSNDWFAMLKKYAENMVAHRQNVFQVPASTIEVSKSFEDELEFDFTRFDQIAEIFWSTGRMDYLETGELFRFGENGWRGSEIIPVNFNVNDRKTGEQLVEGGVEVLPYLLPAIEDHLRQKGWLDKTIFHVKDEPSLHNAFAWKEASRYINQFAPDLQRIDAIETTYVLDDIEIAVPKLDALSSWYETYKKGLENGVELWYYTVGIYQGSLLPNKTIDMPLIDSRILHWLNYKYDANGYLHWGWNQWNEDPFKEVGMHIGDGWHVYPSKDGVLNSLRWEQMRNGIQDYEYFLLLENKISELKDSLGTKFSWIDPKQRSKEILNRVVKGFIEKSDDPVEFYNAKLAVIEELLNSNISPGLYIQTDPVEGSTLSSRSSVEVFGWTEPGTDIVVNGQEIPVNKQGLFLEKFVLSIANPEIIVQAKNDSGTKEIIRKFIVK